MRSYLFLGLLALLIVSPTAIPFFWGPWESVLVDASLRNAKLVEATLLGLWFVITGCVLFFLHRYKWLVSLAVMVSVVVACYVLLVGEKLEYEVFAAIANTNVYEATEVAFSTRIFLVGLVVPVAMYLGMTLARSIQVPVSGRSVAKNNAFLVLLFGLIGLASFYFHHRDALYQTYPLSMPFFLKMYVKEGYQFKNNFAAVVYRPTSAINADKRPTIVLVIGESARAASMSAYGYARSTTPYVDLMVQKNGGAFVYRATSAGISTRLSVPSILSTANAAQFKQISSVPSLLHVFNSSGFETLLISNQETLGRNNDTISLMLGLAGKRIYISGDSATRQLDEAVLDPLRQALGDSRKPLFVVIHLMGSHARYDSRYPDRHAVFGNSLIDTYDNSIYYTDYVLGLLLDNIASSKTPIFMIYTSDHGENFNDCGDGNFLHAVKEMTPYEIEVPLIGFSNREFISSYKTLADNLSANVGIPSSHDNISHTLLGVAGIHDSSVYDMTRDLSSSSAKQKNRFSVNRRLEVVDVDAFLSRFKYPDRCNAS